MESNLLEAISAIGKQRKNDFKEGTRKKQKKEDNKWRRSQNNNLFLFDIFSMSVLNINPTDNDFLRNHFIIKTRKKSLKDIAFY